MIFAPAKSSCELDPLSGKITVTSYSADDVIQVFLFLYEHLDFKNELSELEVSLFHFRRRAKILRELRAISIALWGLALQKSFPHDSTRFFEQFCATAPFLSGKGKEPRQLLSRVNSYVEQLTVKKDTDFLPVADSLTNILTRKESEKPRLRLKISLMVRNLYSFIFDKLV